MVTVYMIAVCWGLLGSGPPQCAPPPRPVYYRSLSACRSVIAAMEPQRAGGRAWPRRDQELRCLSITVPAWQIAG